MFETNLYNQINLASDLFDSAQRSYETCSNEESIKNATKSLAIYRTCFSSIKRRRKHYANSGDGSNRGGSQKKLINLELRMAMILRFLAAAGAGNDTVELQEKIHTAIQYHDDAVSLLVGVFDEGQKNESSDKDDLDEMSDEKKNQQHDKRQVNVEHVSDENTKKDGSRILFTIFVNNTTLAFVTPTENQRVRALSTSLNALASLHANLNDDRSAMNSYREALEILRAATEETEEINHSSEGGKSNVELDLAETLMNVGTFHLRRDELDAALNAYSTVFALHIGDDMNSLSSLLPCEWSDMSSQAVAALNNLGIVHERKGELDKAYKCYHQVRLVRNSISGGDSLEVADAWINIGNCLQRKLDWKEAEFAYGKAVEIYRSKLREELPVLEAVKISRALSGAVRNNGTCYWKQRRIVDAINQFTQGVTIEDEIIASLSSIEGAAGVRDGLHQAKMQGAQLLGIIGCLYLEQTPKARESFEGAKTSFHRAIEIYFELGYTSSHPSIMWTNINIESLKFLEEKSKHASPPPPPPTPPPKKRTPLSPSSINNPEDLQRGVPEHTVNSSRDKPAILVRGTSAKSEVDSVFLGVNDYQSSTDELDDILSERVDNVTQSTKEIRPVYEKNVIKVGPFGEEADCDTGYVGKIEEPDDKQKYAPEEVDFGCSSPQSSKNKNSPGNRLIETPEKITCTRREEELKDKLSKSRKRFGDESEEVACAHIALAEAYWQRGDRVSASEHYSVAHSIFEYKLGGNKSCANILKALGDLNKEDEKYDAATALYTEAMEIENAIYGHCLPTTLNAAGVVCLLKQDHRGAMEFHRRALQFQQTFLEEGNKYEMYETLVLIGNVYYSERNNLSNIRSKGVDYEEFIELGFLSWIANAHDMRGEYMKACQFYEESLHININKKGKESKKETVLMLNRLGSLNRELGRYEEAVDYHQRAMLLQQSSSKTAKAMTAQTCVLMGMTKAKMGHYTLALDLFEDSLLVLKASLGDKHQSIAKTMVQIASVYFELSNYIKAMAILSEVEEYQLANIGEFHRDTFETQALIGRVLSAQGKFDTALVKLHGVVKNQIQMFGENHPSIADTNQCIGECFLGQDMFAEARAMYVDCYNMRKKFFSLDHLIIAESMIDITRARSGSPEKSLAIYRNAMEIYKEYLPDNHVTIGHLLIYEGDVHAELLDFGTAINRYQKASNIFLKAVGEGHLVEADIIVKIGKVLLRKCDYDKAKQQFCMALDIYNSKLPKKHPKILAIAQHLDRVEQEEALCV